MCDAAHHEAVAGEPESDDADRIDDQVHRHRVDRVLRARETGLQHRETDLHEHHEEAGDQHPREVQRTVLHRRRRWRFAHARPPESKKASAAKMAAAQSELRSSRHHLACPRYDRCAGPCARRITICEPNQKCKCPDQRREERDVPKPPAHVLQREAARMQMLRAILRHHLRRIAQILEHLRRARVAIARVALDRVQDDLLEMRIEIRLERASAAADPRWSSPSSRCRRWGPSTAAGRSASRRESCPANRCRCAHRRAGR